MPPAVITPAPSADVILADHRIVRLPVAAATLAKRLTAVAGDEGYGLRAVRAFTDPEAAGFMLMRWEGGPITGSSPGEWRLKFLYMELHGTSGLFPSKLLRDRLAGAYDMTPFGARHAAIDILERFDELGVSKQDLDFYRFVLEEAACLEPEA